MIIENFVPDPCKHENTRLAKHSVSVCPGYNDDYSNCLSIFELIIRYNYTDNRTLPGCFDFPYFSDVYNVPIFTDLSLAAGGVF